MYVLYVQGFGVPHSRGGPTGMREPVSKADANPPSVARCIFSTITEVHYDQVTSSKSHNPDYPPIPNNTMQRIPRQEQKYHEKRKTRDMAIYNRA